MTRMLVMDVNVLVYAHREDVRDYSAYRQWLERVINSNTAYAFSELVLNGFIRIVTHKNIFEQPFRWKMRLPSLSKLEARNRRFHLYRVLNTGRFFFSV